MSITKSELIERVVSKQSQLSARDVELAIKTILEEMSRTLASGGRIEIRGFGSFSLHYREPRTGRNPKTGESVNLDAKYVPHFKPGKELRDRVNQAMALEQSLSGGNIIDAGEGQPEAIRNEILKAIDASQAQTKSSDEDSRLGKTRLTASESEEAEDVLMGHSVMTSGRTFRAASGDDRSTGYAS